MFNISSEHLQRHLVQLLCRVTFSPHRVSHRRSISQGKYYCLKIPHFQLQVLSIWNSHRCPGWAYDQLAQQLAQYGTTAACAAFLSVALGEEGAEGCMSCLNLLQSSVERAGRQTSEKKGAFPPSIPYEQAEPAAWSEKQFVNILLHQVSAVGSAALGKT